MGEGEQVKRCGCGFEASALYFKGGKCPACRMTVGPKREVVVRFEMVECRCGCGETFNKWGARGRPRAYVGDGHWQRHARQRALEAMGRV